jgi:hypothetical protein
MRLMRFLDEAHRRGVLRQNDAHTEFAHQMCKGPRPQSLWTSVPSRTAALRLLQRMIEE